VRLRHRARGALPTLSAQEPSPLRVRSERPERLD
jgi:hypothetical protein